MVTLLCFLSWCLTVILLELDDSLEDVDLLSLYEEHFCELL